MKVSMIIKRLLLSGAMLTTVLLPGFTASTAYASQSMDDMGHAGVDIANCLERHQTPTAPLQNESKQHEREEKNEPIPLEQPYFVAFQKPVIEPIKPALDVITLSSFVPPDIVILTTQLRI